MKGFPETLIGAISLSFQRFADRPALWTDSTTYTYRELEAIACGIREKIDHAGCSGGGRIGILTGDDVYTYASLLAIWSAGCAYVPLNAHNPAERNARIIKQAEIDLLLVSKTREVWANVLPDLRDGPAIVDISATPAIAKSLAFDKTKNTDLAYIFFTSGSTGAPKGVPITHGNLNAFMGCLHNSMGYDFSEQDRFLQMFEMTFDLSVMTIFGAWSCGASCHVVPDSGIAYLNILNILDENKITVALMVPSLLAYLQRFFPELSFPSVRLNLFCGEALIQEMVEQWAPCVPNARIENVYGPTEATIFCTSYPWHTTKSADESVNGIVSIGQAMATCETLIIDSQSRICQSGERGELALAGPQIMSGYWANPQKTAEALVSIDVNGQSTTVYRTGDIAYVNENGNLIYCGRLDSQVKIDGHRVELGEIEHFARQYLGRSKVAVIVTKQEPSTEELHLFFVGKESDIDELKNHLRENLPSYMVPRRVTVLADLPLNMNGKIDRPALARSAQHD